MTASGQHPDAVPRRSRRRGGASPPRRLRRVVRPLVASSLVALALVTVASFVYDAATAGRVAPPPGLRFVDAGGIETRYRTWGNHGPTVVLVPGAFETADTFAALGDALGAGNRVFALDLTGTGYSRPVAPFNADHLAAQLVNFMQAMGLTGPDAPLLVGHSSGAAVVGLAALRAGQDVSGVVFLDGDATPLARPGLLAMVAVDPYRTTALRLVVRSDWIIREVYNSQCGPGCPRLTAAGVAGWRRPLEQPGFASCLAYMLRHGIPSLTPAQFDGLRRAQVAKGVIYGRGDPQLGSAAAAALAARIGAPAAMAVPGRHLTMISSPTELARAIQAWRAAARR